MRSLHKYGASKKKEVKYSWKLNVKYIIFSVISSKFTNAATFILLIGAVERVKKIRDYAFVHFNNREDAVEAMKALNGKVK